MTTEQMDWNDAHRSNELPRVDPARVTPGARKIPCHAIPAPRRGKHTDPALVEAVQQVAEQLRLSNLIGLASLADRETRILSAQVANDAALALTEYHEHSSGGWQLRPEIAETLGVEL